MRVVHCAIGLTLVLGACATPAQIQARADAHEARARMCEARGDYTCAAEQREAALRQYRKAAARAGGRYPM